MRKDLERAFGVLVSRFHVLKYPAKLSYRSHISIVMKACFILHNMVVESGKGSYKEGMCALRLCEDARVLFDTNAVFTWESKDAIETRNHSMLSPNMWASMVSSRQENISNTQEHFSLKQDLINYICDRQGGL